MVAMGLLWVWVGEIGLKICGVGKNRGMGERNKPEDRNNASAVAMVAWLEAITAELALIRP